MKIWGAGLSALALAVATPAVAQDEEQTEEQADELGMEALGEAITSDPDFQKFLQAFKPEPLTPEQEALVPLASDVVGAMIPQGAMGEMFSAMFQDLTEPFAMLGGDSQTGTASELLGWYVDGDDLGEDTSAEVVAIIDPAREQRKEAEMQAIQDGIIDVMAALEPAMREAMAKAYAANFTRTELTDIGAFFSTPSGASFASKSYKLASDPRIWVGMLDNLPELIGPIMGAVMEGQAKVEALPQAKTYADLTPGERSRLTALTGLTESELEEAMSLADEAPMEEAEDATEDAADAMEEDYDS